MVSECRNLNDYIDRNLLTRLETLRIQFVNSFDSNLLHKLCRQLRSLSLYFADMHDLIGSVTKCSALRHLSFIFCLFSQAQINLVLNSRFPFLESFTIEGHPVYGPNIKRLNVVYNEFPFSLVKAQLNAKLDVLHLIIYHDFNSNPRLSKLTDNLKLCSKYLTKSLAISLCGPNLYSDAISLCVDSKMWMIHCSEILNL